MALSMSGEDEEYESESEQVNVFTLYLNNIVPYCELYRGHRDKRKAFFSGYFRLTLHPLFLCLCESG